MHYCPSCDAKPGNNAHFCSHCGFALNTATTLDEETNERKSLPTDVREEVNLVLCNRPVAINNKLFSPTDVQSSDVTNTTVRLSIVQHKKSSRRVAICPSCETELGDKAHFCSHCGHALRATNTVDSTVDVETSHQADMQPSNVSIIVPRLSTFYYEIRGKLPLPIQSAITAMLTRALDPEPEKLRVSGQKLAGKPATTWRWLPILTLTSALAMLLLAYAYTSSRYGAKGVDNFFWLGVLLMFVPPIVRIISSAASRFERMCLLCIPVTCFYLIDVVGRGGDFSGHDPLIHARSADDIARSAHLFIENPLLPASPFYPGLEIVTNALSKLSGLNAFAAGSIVIGLARLLLILSLFMLYERLTKSARVAGIATLLYMANPHFLFFDASFSYESLALPLAILVLFATLRQDALSSGRRWIMLTVLIPLAAVVTTHHVTSFILTGLLLLWAVIGTFQRPSRLFQSNVAKVALCGILMVLAWISLRGNPVVEYLSSYFGTALDELGHILNKTSSARQFFAVYAGQPAPLWERLMALSSVALICLSLPFGLLCIWQRYRHNALAYMFGIVTFFYPLSHVFRFTEFGSEITDRAAAFLFIPLGFVLAIFIAQFWPIRWLNWKQISFLTCAISVVFMGGIILGAGQPWQLLPGPYLVAADERSIEPEGIQAAEWMLLNLGPNHRIATDRTNRLLMSTYGDQRAVTFLSDNVDVTVVFFSPTIGPNEESILLSAKVRYLVVDLRLATALPSLGIYFEPGEPGSFHHTIPISPKALTKFSSVPQINRVFDSGNIVIYDVGGLMNAP